MIIAHIKVLLVVLIINKNSIEGNKLPTKTENVVHVTSIRCLALKKNVMNIECTLKPVNRTLKYLSMTATLTNPPVNDLKIHFRMLKKANHYQPFGMDATIDICQLLNGKKNPIFEWVFSLVKSYSLRGRCPLKANVLNNQRGFFLTDMPLNKLPFPSLFPDGDFRLEFVAYSLQKMVAYFSLDMKVQEETVF